MKPLAKVRHMIERHAMLAGARGVVVAVSGGPDSVALLDMLMRWRDAHANESGAVLPLHVAHLNHQLRGADSDADAEFVRRLAERLSLPATIDEADVRAAAEAARRGIEETAREIRYRFLLGVARATGADRIATGHTMSDQAETFLMRLARGAGTQGLAAMRPVSAVPTHNTETQRHRDTETVSLVRPLLGITREEVEAYCNERRVAARIDATNLAGDFTRNRVRRDVLPALRAINPRAVHAIARAAEHLAADQDALDELAKELLDAARIEQTTGAEAMKDWLAAYRVALLRAQPAALQRRMLREAIRQASTTTDARGEITAKHIAAIEALLAERASGKRVRLSGGLEIWREYDAIIFKPIAGAGGEATDAGYALEFSATRSRIEVGGLILMIERGLPADQYASLIERARQLKQARGRDWMMAVLDDDALPATLIIRPRPRGARARVAGHGQTIKLKKLMIDHTIPASRRAAWPVVMTRDDRYVWSPGLPPAVDFAAHGETRHLAIVRALNR